MKIPELKLLDGHTLLISGSSLEKLQSCPTMMAYYKLWRRELAGGRIAAQAGKAMHLALESRAKDRNRDFTEEHVAQALDALAKEYATIEVPPDDHRTLPRMEDVLRGYAKAYPRDPWEVLATEMPFAVPLGHIWISQDAHRPSYKPLSTEHHFYETKDSKGFLSLECRNKINVIWRGLIDLLVRWGSEVFVVDRKTMSDWGKRKLAQYRNDAKSKGYCWAVQELHHTGRVPELPARVHGFCLDAIVVRAPLQRASAKGNLPREEFHRERFYYGPEILEEWKASTLDSIQAWLGFYAQGRFPMHTHVCANFYGGQCEFLQVCELPPEQRALMLSTDEYQDVKLSPLDKA